MSVATRFFRLLCNKAIPVSGHWDDTIYCKDLPHIYSMIIFLDHLVYLFCHSAERIQKSGK
ncbi:hypothetical protein [Wolbachia endosymbiont (group A) of Bibio marci]|uniref:hypothetical protein n=1 Tax=Wolbachia endosymbiont (group A) of Bibio marci TaxID=2953987 RepID=UPI00222F35DB|nr:hypothetical protein [Wolbachia endosymbiont (group A) of Bibio marci]